MLRKLLLFLLMLGVAGFGVCSLCGGVMGISFLTEARASSRDAAWLAFGLSALGAALVWLCWFGIRKLWQRGQATEPPRSGPA